MASFGERLKSLRESKGFTQDELAEKVGVTKQAISQYERGVRRPDFDTLSALCDLFNVSTDFLLGKSDYTSRLLCCSPEMMGISHTLLTTSTSGRPRKRC